MAFMDTTCPRCGKRLGWSGTVFDRPACPRCGHRPTNDRLKKDQEQIDKFKQELESGKYDKFPDSPTQPPEIP